MLSNIDICIFLNDSLFFERLINYKGEKYDWFFFIIYVLKLRGKNGKE